LREVLNEIFLNRTIKLFNYPAITACLVSNISEALAARVVAPVEVGGQRSLTLHTTHHLGTGASLSLAAPRLTLTIGAGGLFLALALHAAIGRTVFGFASLANVPGNIFAFNAQHAFQVVGVLADESRVDFSLFCKKLSSPSFLLPTIND